MFNKTTSEPGGFVANLSLTYEKEGGIEVLAGPTPSEGSLLRTPWLVKLTRKIWQKIIQQINLNRKMPLN
jgi:hypothetical protein